VSPREAPAVIIGPVDAIRVGRTLRALRHRLGWRQRDVGARAGVSQQLVSRAERGRIEAIDLRTLRALAGTLDAELVVAVRWRAGDLDRLLDEAHAALVGHVASELAKLDWLVCPEVSYSVFGERGSIDLVGWHGPTAMLLVIEVKTELVSVEETLRRHDSKVRLGPRIVAERFDWQPRAAVRMLVLPDTSTSRRRGARHAALLERSYPLRGPAARAWLRRPSGGVGCLWFVPVSSTRGVSSRSGSVNRKRIAGPARHRSGRVGA
jgi:transcriptional regulator with XRE-family HTH domain